jgi:hypothetical protein
MTAHDPLHDRQTGTGTLVLVLPMQTLKNAEKLAGVPHIKPGAIVAHEVGVDVAAVSETDLDAGRLRSRVNLTALDSRLA